MRTAISASRRSRLVSSLEATSSISICGCARCRRARTAGRSHVAAHEAYLAKAPPLARPDDLRAHRLIGFDRDDTILRGFAKAGLTLARADFALRTDDQVAYGRLVAEGAGVGFVARYNLRYWPGVVRLLPEFVVPPLPCWLAVHREIRSNALV